MTMTTMQRVRVWQGPAVFSYGFRPFFLGAALWAGAAMCLWVAALASAVELPVSFDPVSWHAHEFLFGYLGAVAAGFLLTSVPNWTGRLPIVGWPLCGLFSLWLLGRMTVGTSAWWPAPTVAALDLTMPVALAAAIGREIVKGRNWRNMVVLGNLGVLIVGNGLFHWEAAHGAYAAEGIGLRIGLSGAIAMIAMIGGRIVPSFTRNWLAKRGAAQLPAPVGRFDQVTLLALVAALAQWCVLPHGKATHVALMLAGVLHIARLARWQGFRTLSEPLVWVLHVGYAFVPLGAIAAGVAGLAPSLLAPAVALHVWTAGAIGLMTLAVMTRATLGHTGQALTAGPGTAAIYVGIVVSVTTRFLSGFVPAWGSEMMTLAGLAWIAAFLGFALLYGAPLLRPRPGR